MIHQKSSDTVIDARRKTRFKQDMLGHDIVPGARVAYNYSGNVASGVVEKVSSEIYIRRDAGFPGANPISKVKHPSSVLVLNDQEEAELLAAYRNSYDELSKQWEEAFVEKEENLRTQYVDKQTELEGKYKQFVADLRNAWDIDEAKMLVEHHFGDYVE